jgi:primosomal protein N' (replication factor Y)
MAGTDDRRVARVHVDSPLPHLDRLFDYEVPPELDAIAQPGVRVKVRFAGRTVDAYLMDRVVGSDTVSLLPLAKVVSPEVVVPAAAARLIRAVADHYAGTFVDVARFAVPPRHATTEKAEPKPPPEATDPRWSDSPLDAYPDGTGWVEAVRRGESPRAAWQVVPVASLVGDWTDAFAAAAAAAVVSGRSAVLVVPLVRDVERLAQAVERRTGVGTVVRMTGEVGPSARYRGFLRALRGLAQVVVGTRSAAFAPLPDLGLVALWDDGDDHHQSPQAPYFHARDVAALRVSQQGAAFLVAGHLRTAEVQAWVERGWMRPIALSPAETRRVAPVVRVAVDRDRVLERDPAARAARLPLEVFGAIRTALAAGPVLLHTPYAGYVKLMACQSCRRAARCGHCQGPLRADGPESNPGCGWCGSLAVDWVCATCGGRRLRSVLVGAERTAEEIGRAFPGVPVRQSSQGRLIDAIDDAPSLVIATPGAEPPAPSGYAAAVLLDSTAALNRPDLRVAEECMRRWLAVTGLVRPASAGGTVLAVAESDSRTIQALVRLDPVGFAEVELEDRRSAGFPPAARMAIVEGESSAVSDACQALDTVAGIDLLGPVEVGDQPPHPGADVVAWHRLLARTPVSAGGALAAALKHLQGIRSARKDPRPLRVRVDGL